MDRPRPTDGGEGDRGSRAEELFAAWLARRSAAGDAPGAIDELIAAHPDLADELREYWAAHRAFAAHEGELGLGAVHPTSEAAGVRGRQLEADLEELETYNPRCWPFGDESSVGGGGFGYITETRELGLGRRLALKRPKVEDPTRLEEHERVRVVRLVEEGRLLGRLDHPAIVPLHAMATDERGLPYLSMRFVEGMDFGEAVRLGRAGDARWTLPRLVEVLLRVCEAVAYAHERKIIHRDLKPDNVRVGTRGEVYVMDWGLGLDLTRGRRHDDGAGRSPVDPRAEAIGDTLDDRLTEQGAAMGTPSYMAPEQWRGDLRAFDERTDVYALGAILLYVLTGEHPEPARTGKPQPTADDAPPALLAIAQRAMSKEPTQRYRSAVEMGDELQAFLDRRVVQAYETGPWAELRSWIGRNKLASGLGVAIFLLVATAGVVLTAKNDQLNETIDELNDTTLELQATNTDLEASNDAIRRQTSRTIYEQAVRQRGLGSPTSVLELLEDVPDPSFEPVHRALLRGRALVELGRLDEARDVLAQADAAHDAGDLRDELLTLLAQIAVVQDRRDDFDALLEEVVDEELSPHPQALLQAWLAKTAETAVEHLRTAVDEDPQDSLARSQLAILLSLLDERESAARQVEVGRALQPDAVSLQAAAVLTALFAQDHDAARRHAERLDAEQRDAYVALIDTWSSTTVPTPEEAQEMSNVLPQALKLGNLFYRASELGGGQLFHPVVGDFISKVGTGLVKLPQTLLMKTSAAHEDFEAAYAIVPEAFVGWLLGMLRAATCSFEPEQATVDMRAAEELLHDASQRSSIVPNTGASIHSGLIGMQWVLAIAIQRDPDGRRELIGDLEQRFAENADWLMANRPPHAWTAQMLQSTAQILGDLPRAERVVRWGWRGREDTPEALTQRVALRRAQRNRTEELAVARRWLELHPDDSDARAAVEDAESRLAKTLADLGWNSEARPGE